jgi:type IV pilus assembly protein PilX
MTTTMELQKIYAAKFQRGVSLVLVMVFLVILSILGITAMQSSTLSARVARNEADRNVAFQAAEAALRDAENDITYKRFDKTACSTAIAGCRAAPIDGLLNFDATCTNGLCAGVAGSAPWETATVWATTGNSVAYGTRTGATALPFVAQQPRYLIEGFTLGDDTVYRVTSVGFGANLSTQIMLQSSVKQ